MQIVKKDIKIKDLVKGYRRVIEKSTDTMDGRLNIMPEYQREFLYSRKRQEEVIWSVLNNYPLNAIYWLVNDDKSNKYEYEVIDGMQRIMSICEFVAGAFSISFIDNNPRYYSGLSQMNKDKINNYVLQVSLCKGSRSEILKLLENLNIPPLLRNKQELYNIAFSGPWVNSARQFFSKTKCQAYNLGKDYLPSGINFLRQDCLELVLKWISKNQITEYMAAHQKDNDASELIEYFKNVISWIKNTFPNYLPIMKDQPWGIYYDKYKNRKFDIAKINEEIAELYHDEEVTNKKGIFEYIFTREEKHLSIRTFDKQIKMAKLKEQHGVCNWCKAPLTLGKAHADHIIPWSKGGKTTLDNCQVLCLKCNATKGSKNA